MGPYLNGVWLVIRWTFFLLVVVWFCTRHTCRPKSFSSHFLHQWVMTPLLSIWILLIFELVLLRKVEVSFTRKLSWKALTVSLGLCRWKKAATFNICFGCRVWQWLKMKLAFVRAKMYFFWCYLISWLENSFRDRS